MVYNDAFESAKIMPLKILKGHKVTNGFGIDIYVICKYIFVGVMDIEFHP